MHQVLKSFCILCSIDGVLELWLSWLLLVMLVWTQNAFLVLTRYWILQD